MAQLAVSPRSVLRAPLEKGIGFSKWLAAVGVSVVLTPVLAIALLPAALAVLVLVPTVGLWLGIGAMARV